MCQLSNDENKRQHCAFCNDKNVFIHVEAAGDDGFLQCCSWTTIGCISIMVSLFAVHSSDFTILIYVVVIRNECENQVKGFSGAVYKKFKTLEEAESFASLNANGYSVEENAPSGSKVSHFGSYISQELQLLQHIFENKILILLPTAARTINKCYNRRKKAKNHHRRIHTKHCQNGVVRRA